MEGRARLSTCSLLVLLIGIPVCCPAEEITVGLRYDGNATDCVMKDSRDMSNYCLTVYQDGQPLADQALTCYLEHTLVYNCTSDRKCTAHGPLKDNTVPSGEHSCAGLPFANINTNHLGRYTCHLYDNNATASFNVSYCKDGDILDVWLSKGGVKVDCVSRGERKVDDYCLEVKLDDGSRPSDFQCKFKEDVVYTCTEFDNCKEFNALDKHGTIPRRFSQKCSGIPFANMDDRFLGLYRCFSKDSTGIQLSGLHTVTLCSDHFGIFSSTSESSLRPEEDETKEVDELSIYKFEIVVIIITCVFINITIAGYCAYLWYSGRLNTQNSRTQLQEQEDKNVSKEKTFLSPQILNGNKEDKLG